MDDLHFAVSVQIFSGYILVFLIHITLKLYSLSLDVRLWSLLYLPLFPKKYFGNLGFI